MKAFWRRTTWREAAGWAAIVTLAVMLGWVIGQVAMLADEASQTKVELDRTEQALERARERSAERQAAIDALAEGQRTMRDQLFELGEIPRAPDPDITVRGPAGERGPRGFPGIPGPPPSDLQVASAVTAYLTANPPAPGRPPTDGEIAAAVADFCGDGRCRGPAGADGQDGAGGADGATGPRGPGPTDEQVAAAVAAYCDARNQCRGPAGPTGATGPAGRDGQDGEPPVSWTWTEGPFTYTCQRDDPFDPDAPTYSCDRTRTGPNQ